MNEKSLSVDEFPDGGDTLESLTAEVASLVLYQMYGERALDFLQTLEGECYFNLQFTWPIWIGRRTDERAPDDLVPRFPYNFSKLISGKRWLFQRTTRHMAFAELDFGGGEKTAAAIELGRHPLHGLEYMGLFTVGSLSALEQVRTSMPANTHLRVLRMANSGRTGILLPKRMDWYVLPLPELTFGPEPVFFDPALRPLALDEFVAPLWKQGGPSEG